MLFFIDVHSGKLGGSQSMSAECNVHETQTSHQSESLCHCEIVQHGQVSTWRLGQRGISHFHIVLYGCWRVWHVVECSYSTEHSSPYSSLSAPSQSLCSGSFSVFLSVRSALSSRRNEKLVRGFERCRSGTVEHFCHLPFV